MNKTLKKTLSIILTILMIVATIPFAFAVEADYEIKPGDTYTVTKKELVKFVPTVSGNHIISSVSDVDPIVTLFDADLAILTVEDDSGYREENGLDFYLKYECTAGETYYFEFYDFNEEYNYTVTIIEPCSVHTGGTQTCKGFECEVCGEWYGEAGEHTAEGEQTCLGTLCSVCVEYFGEASEHDLSSEQTCLGYYCYSCEDYYGEADPNAHNWNDTHCDICGDEHEHTGGTQTCKGFKCEICGSWYGEANEQHDLSTEQNCMGYKCNLCYRYVGEKGEHVPNAEQTCKGYRCKYCYEWFGEADTSKHSWYYGYCYYCNIEYPADKECTHDLNEFGKCKTCGYQCPHEILENGVCTVCDYVHTFSVITGDTVSYYDSFDDALENAEEGSTVKLMKEIHMIASYEINKSITFDFNGNSWETGTSGDRIDVNASVTFTDSVGTGYLNLDLNLYAPCLFNGGTYKYINIDFETEDTLDDYLADCHAYFDHYTEELLDLSSEKFKLGVTVKPNHNLGEQTCKGYLCGDCEEYFGEADPEAHTAPEAFDCTKGYACTVCGQTMVEAVDAHIFENGACKVCGITGGYCGASTNDGGEESVTWTLDSDGVLTISGTGAMADYYNDGPFYGKSNITIVVIKDGVTSISYDAFYSCYNLESVTIPDSVTSIGDYAFDYCYSLESIIVDEDNGYYSSDETGVLFNKDKTTLIQYPVGNSGTSYTIPDSVTSIGEYAFYRCTSLASVTIPDSVTSIGERAFGSCTSLESITVDEDNEYYSSENGVLFNKDKTTLIQYPTGNSSILYTIPDSVTSIGGSAFSGCTSLASVTIPDSVTSIGSYAFDYTACYNDENNWENGVLYIGNHLIVAEYDISGNYSVKSGTKTIAGDAFAYCTSLESIEIPDSVTSINDYAFYYCTSLASVTIPDSVTSIGDYAFEYCTSLTLVHYLGTSDQWDKIEIGSANTDLTGATRHYCTEAAATVTCTEDGYTTGWYCTDCEEYIVGGEETTALGHVDADGDYVCDNDCGHEFEKPVDPTPDTPDEPTDNNCDHLCHSDNAFIQFVWKIISFLQRLFGIQQYCDCGQLHY